MKRFFLILICVAIVATAIAAPPRGRKYTSTIKRKDFPGASEIQLRAQGIDPESTAQVTHALRITSIDTSEPSTIHVKFQVWLVTAFGNSPVGGEQTLSILPEAQPPEPQQNITDPDTGAVIVPAGAIRGPIPAFDTFMAQALPRPFPMPKTFGDVFNAVHVLILNTNEDLRNDLSGGIDTDL